MNVMRGRSLVIATALLMRSAFCCFGQDAAKPASPIMLESKRDSLAVMSETCVEVEIGGEKTPTLGCLNQRLKRQVDSIQPSVNAPPIDARSPDVRLGIANETAIRQQYGPNLGQSAVPFRPPAGGNYPNPIFGRR